MRSVADDLREERRLEARGLSVEEGLGWAFRLGEQDLALVQAAYSLDRRAALRLVRRQRQAGRQPSRCIEELLL
jgi:hypothetical protein